MASDLIPWAKAEFWGREREYVQDAISSTWISGGPYVTRLESQFSGLLGGRIASRSRTGRRLCTWPIWGLDCGPATK